MAKGNGKKDPVEQLLEEVKKGFEGVNQRLDGILKLQGDHFRRLEEKVERHDREIAALKRKAS
jgi:hypothetical protein